MRGFGRAAWLATLLLVALAVASCGGKPPEATPTPSESAGRVTQPTTAALATQAPGATAKAPATPAQAASPTPEAAVPTPTPPPPEPTATPEEVPTPQAFADWWNALQGAATFRGRTTMQSSDGTSFVAELERVKEPPAARTVLHVVDQEGKATDMELILIENVLYLRTKEGETWGDWMSMTTEQTEEGMSPSDIFSAPFMGLTEWTGRDLEVVDRHENVNGIDTTHYRISDTAMAQFIRTANLPGEGEEKQEETLSYTKAQADFWVANQGKYLVKSSIHLEGVENDKPVTWDLATEVLAVNEPLKIEAPAGAAKPGLPEDVPPFPGAKMTASIQGMTSFQTSASLKEVADFYKRELPARGWTLQEGGMETDQMAMYTFSKGDRSCQVMITREGETTNLNIFCQ
jgi:hypothetical protein